MIKNKISSLYEYVFYILCLFLPLSDLAKAVPNLLIIVLIVLFFFLQPLKLLKEPFHKSFKILLILISLMLLLTIIELRWEDLKILSRILLIPLIIILSKPIKNTTNILYSFLIGSLILLSISVINIVSFYLEHHFISFNTGDHINDLLAGERPYVGFTYLFGICTSLHLYPLTKSATLKYIHTAIILFFSMFIILISARIALLSLLFISLLYIFRTTKKKYLLYKFLFISGILFTIFAFSKNLQQRFFISPQEILSSQSLSAEPRFHIWSCAFSIDQNFKTLLLGSGFTGTENKLTDCYTERDSFLSQSQKEWFVSAQFNTHNQFIGVYLSFGIVTLIVFIMFFYFLFKESLKRKTMLNYFLILFLFCITENILHRQLGCMLMALVLVNIYKNNYTKSLV